MGYRLAVIDGEAALVNDASTWFSLARLVGDHDDHPATDDITGWLQRPAELDALSARLDQLEPDGTIDDAPLYAPVPRPRNVFAVGLNYRSHAEESGIEPPTVPLVFTKFPSSISPPDSDVSLASVTTDYEVELVVVIGRGGRDIQAAEAWDHVAGVTVGQDFSDRVLQFAAQPPHFDLAKSRDTYGPIGPYLVSPDLLDDPDDLAITCRVNGEVRQQDRTSNLIFGVGELVAYLSSLMTLAPGDLIFTGTPAGVGFANGHYLVPGDTVESTIEGVGTITNRCRP
jgi:2-keto-4-pentenoate hydratase/2-oxohepta-3-ene-1,7-dioic acid hydratase in catechol pathway